MQKAAKRWGDAGLIAAMIPAAVFAAPTGAAGNGGTNGASDQLATITVTAQKRAESAQSVPLSMTTFTSAALQEKAITTFFDYATKVPNLSFARPATASAPRAPSRSAASRAAT